MTRTRTRACGNTAAITAVLTGRATHQDLWHTTPIGTASGLLHRERIPTRIHYSEHGWGELAVHNPRTGTVLGHLRHDASRYTSMDGARVNGATQPWMARYASTDDLPNEYLGRFPTVMATIHALTR